MKYYVKAFYKDGTQKLGNLWGSTVINEKQYKRTDKYKSLVHGFKCPTSYWIIETEDGQFVEKIINKHETVY